MFTTKIGAHEVTVSLVTDSVELEMGIVDREGGPVRCIEERWTLNGSLDRTNAPAIIVRDLSTGQELSREFYRNGKRHRPDGPAIEKLESGEKWRCYYIDGACRNPVDPGAPSSVCVDPTSNVLTSQLWTDERSKLHRIGGPASVQRDAATGVVVHEEYRVHGKYHRVDGPAIITRSPETGITMVEEYYVQGVRHRADGPAIVERDAFVGSVVRQEYFLQGIQHISQDAAPQFD